MTTRLSLSRPSVGAGALALAAAFALSSCAICGDTMRTVGVEPPHDFGAPAIDTAKDVGESLGNIAHSSSRAIENISAQDEVAVGQGAAIAVLAGYGGLVNDQPLVDYVNDIANVLGQHSKRVPRKDGTPRMKSRRFYVGVLADDSLNAFSVPGGFVFVTRGLVQNVTSESDLAFVLAHEIAHVDQEHNLTTLKAEVGANAFASQVAKELQVAGKDANGNALGFDNQKFFNLVVGKLAEIKKSANPAQEREADRIGLQTMMAAGYDPRGADRVLDLLATQPTAKGYDAPAVRKQALHDMIASRSGRSGAQRFAERAGKRIDATLATTE